MKHWHRKLWGVEFTGNDGRPMLIGSAWSNHKPTPYEGEPTRALLFCTRKQAREWCSAEMAAYAGRTDVRSKWRFRPARVVEIVRVVK